MANEPLFTSDQIKADGQNRVVRGVGQTAMASAIVVLGAAFFRKLGWLHGTPDLESVGAWITLLTGSAAALTNLGRLRGRG